MQTLGDLANFNPHVHVLATDGAFLADGSLAALRLAPPYARVDHVLNGSAGTDTAQRPARNS